MADAATIERPAGLDTLQRSVRLRFSVTMAANLVRSGVSFGTSLLLARGLGPSGFGDMAFLLGSFAAAQALIDAGTSSAFFTFVSQRQRSRGFVFAYFAWLAAQCLVPLAVIAWLFPSTWVAEIWRGNLRSVVLLAFA